MRHVQYKELQDGEYICTKQYVYYSPRYNRSVTVNAGFPSDGATWAIDIDSDAWWVHDVLCDRTTWDDGTKASNWQASRVISDILRAEGYGFRTYSWKWMTYFLGGTELMTWWRRWWISVSS